MNQDRMTGLFVSFASLALFCYTLDWPEGYSNARLMLTPYFAPRLILGAMILSGLLLAVTSTQGDRFVWKNLISRQTGRLVLFAGMFFMSATIMGWDFFIGALILCVVFLMITGISFWKSLVLAMVISGAIFIIFRFVFKLMIPATFLMNLLT